MGKFKVKVLLSESHFTSNGIKSPGCSRDAGKNVRPSATKTVRGPQTAQQSRSEDSFGGTRADIFARGPRAPGDFNIITQNSDFPPFIQTGQS